MITTTVILVDQQITYYGNNSLVRFLPRVGRQFSVHRNVSSYPRAERGRGGLNLHD